MNLHDLIDRHQVSILRAEHPACIEARCSHQGLAALYAERIDHLRRGTKRVSARADTLGRAV